MNLEEISAEAAQETEVVQETGTEEPAQETGTEATEAETEAETDPIDIVKSLPQKKKTAQERIAEMTWKQREAERQAEYWKQQAIEKSISPVQSASLPEDRPRLESFDTSESYEDALMQWHLNKATEKERETKQKERESEALRNFNNKAQKIREIHEDFDEIVEAPVFTKVMRDVLLRSEHGPIIAYYLGRAENIQTAQKIANLPSELQSYEIGKLETQLLIAQKTKKVPSAPSPITPVGSSGVHEPVDESKLTDQEWFELQRHRTKENLKKKYGG